MSTVQLSHVYNKQTNTHTLTISLRVGEMKIADKSKEITMFSRLALLFFAGGVIMIACLTIVVVQCIVLVHGYMGK